MLLSYPISPFGWALVKGCRRVRPPEIANTMLLFNLGMFMGVICIGAIAGKLQSFNIRPIFVLELVCPHQF